MPPTDSMPVPGALSARSRVDAVLEWTARSLADEFHEVEVGWVARSRTLPLVYSLNRLQVQRDAAPEQVVALADTHLGDLPYRHVEIGDERGAAAFERALVAPGSGWKVDREVLMVLGEPRPSEAGGEAEGGEVATAPPGALVRLGEEEADGLMRRWHLEETLDTLPGVLEQLSAYNRGEGALWGEEVLGVREAGEAVALTKLRPAHDGVGWVEDVYTIPAARRKGYARLLVQSAVGLARDAGNEVTFIIADDNDWPKHLYAALGFRPIGCTWTFHRDLTR